MGLYDSVRFRCPHCNERFLEQTKAGECNLVDYDAQHVPLIIAAFLNDERVFCPHCENEFVMRAEVPTTVSISLSRVDQEDE